jgi:hypothetical protein
MIEYILGGLLGGALLVLMVLTIRNYKKIQKDITKLPDEIEPNFQKEYKTIDENVWVNSDYVPTVPKLDIDNTKSKKNITKVSKKKEIKTSKKSKNTNPKVIKNSKKK